MSRRRQIEDQRIQLALVRPDRSAVKLDGPDPIDADWQDITENMRILEGHSVEIARATAPFGLAGIHARKASSDVSKIQSQSYGDAGWGNHERHNTEDLNLRVLSINNRQDREMMYGISNTYLDLADRVREKGMGSPQDTEAKAAAMEYHAEVFNQHGIKSHVRAFAASKGSQGLLDYNPDLNTAQLVGLLRGADAADLADRRDALSEKEMETKKLDAALDPEFWEKEASLLSKEDYADHVFHVRHSAIENRAGMSAGIRRDDVQRLAMVKMARVAHDDGIKSQTGDALDILLTTSTGQEQDEAKSARSRASVSAMRASIESKIADPRGKSVSTKDASHEL